MYRRLHHILILLLACVLRVSAQGIVTFTSDQGLSNSCIHSMMEDSYHNVWISTRNGLNMYDGAKLRNFFHHEGDSTSLINDVVTNVVELVPGKLLVGTNSGLCLYDYSTSSFREIALYNEHNVPSHPRIVDICLRKDGSALIMATARTSYVVTDTPEGVKASPCLDYLINDYGASHFVEGRDGRQWVLSRNYEVAYFMNGRAHVMKTDGRALHIVEGTKDNIYVDVEGRGLCRYDDQLDEFVLLPLPELSNVIIKKLRACRDGYIYVCTDGNGLYLFNEGTGELELSKVRISEYNLATSNIEDAMLDAAGNLWIGIYWKGVVVQPHVASAFEYVGRRSALRNAIGTNCVTAIYPAGDDWLWVGTDHGGLYRLNPECTDSRHFQPGETEHVPGTITAIYQDGSGTLWLGSSLGGVVCMNPRTGGFSPFELKDASGRELKKVYSICGDSHDNLWFATMGEGIYGYNREKQRLDHYTTPGQGGLSPEYEILGNVWANTVAVDGNLLYLGHASGLDCFRIGEDGRLKLQGHYLDTNVSDVAVDNHGIVWAATGKGLYRMKLFDDKAEITRLTQQDGLSNDLVRSVELNYLPNHEYEVWVGTDNGLNCYVPSAHSFRRFFIGDGLQGNEFTERASTRMGNRLVFGGVNGLNYFVPSEVIRTTDESTVKLRIVGLYLQGELVNAGQQSDGYTIYQSWINEAEELHFCHSDNNIAIELSTQAMFQNSVYEYSLDGEDWVSLGNGQNRLMLNILSVGTHELHIRVTSNGKVSDERQLRIVVHAPWYASFWMILLYMVAVGVGGYLVYNSVRTHIRAKRLMAEKRQEEEIAEARIQFFMNISHEIRTPMTLILAPLERLRAMDDDEEHKHNYNLIYQNAQRILQLINQMMDVRKIEKGQFQLEYQRVEMVGFIRDLYELFETTSQRRRISLNYHHDMDRLDVQVDASSIDKVLMNLLSNSMKFTAEGGYVNIDLTDNPKKGTFMITVTDTGIGIGGNKDRIFKRFYSGHNQNGYIGTGIGLNLTYLLVQLHKGEIRVMDNPKDHGTRFEVELPYRNPDAKDDALVASALQELPVDKLAGSHHRNLLLVEDDAEIRQYLHAELSSGFNVLECSNGKEAWEHVQRMPESVDIVITDIMMPLMGGDELCQRIKANFNTSHIPVIMLSAKNSDSDRIAGMSIGADAYMTKPFNVDLLRTTAMTILQNHQSLQHRAETAQKTEEVIGKVKLVSPDEQLMDRVMKCINENMGNPDLSVEFVADAVGVSRVHFHRKLKELAGQTPRDFIRNIRMKQAARLLREKHLDITDVSIATGFRSLSTFSSTFKQIYGMTPTEYMNAKKTEPK